MEINGIRKWMNLIPTLIGVTLSIVGMYALPRYGIRNTWGPILGLPLGMIIGAAILARMAKTGSE